MTPLHVITSIWQCYMTKRNNFLFTLMRVMFIYAFCFSLGFQKYLSVNHISKQGKPLECSFFHNIITVFFQDERKHEHTKFLFFIYVRWVQKYLSTNHILKQRKPPGLYFFKMRITWTHEVSTFYICNMSSKVFLNKPHTETEETTWTCVPYILKEFHNFLEVLSLWQI